MSNVYDELWYAQCVAPNHGIYDDGTNRFIYERNGDELASIYGYPGIAGNPADVRARTGGRLFIRHRVDVRDAGGIARPTRVIPCACPWDAGSPHLKEAARAERLGIRAIRQPTVGGVLSSFAVEYYAAMGRKSAADKYYAIAERLDSWADNPQVHVFTTENAGALFLTGMPWAHYHLSYRKPTAHNTEMHAIFAAAVPFIASLGCTHIHLGGGTTPSLDDPLYKFKSRIGRLPWTVYFQEVP